MIDLTGRTVVVSGAGGGGIGTTITKMVAAAGASVVAVSRSKENLARHVEPLAGDITLIPADVTTDEGIATVMEATGDDLYGLVNVAGGAGPATWMPSTRVTREDWRALMTWNLESMVFMSQAVAAKLRKNSKPGSIVSVSSISGLNTAPLHIGYGTAKAALIAATRTMAVELAPHGIRVNAIAPGVTETPASQTYVDQDPERDRRAIAMGRRGTPEEQAGAILFFLSDLAGYVTGQTLLVDGGLDLRWTHLAADNTSLFLKDQDFRAAITRE